MDDVCIKNTSYGISTVKTEWYIKNGAYLNVSRVRTYWVRVLRIGTYLKSVFFLIVMKTENEWTS